MIVPLLNSVRIVLHLPREEWSQFLFQQIKLLHCKLKIIRLCALLDAVITMVFIIDQFSFCQELFPLRLISSPYVFHDVVLQFLWAPAWQFSWAFEMSVISFYRSRGPVYSLHVSSFHCFICIAKIIAFSLISIPAVSQL